jgi:hypothetical protein
MKIWSPSACSFFYHHATLLALSHIEIFSTLSCLTFRYSQHFHCLAFRFSQHWSRTTLQNSRICFCLYLFNDVSHYDRRALLRILHVDVCCSGLFHYFGTSCGSEQRIYGIYFLPAFVLLKHSNALFERMPRNEILLELCPAETNVLSDAGAICNVNIEMCWLFF